MANIFQESKYGKNWSEFIWFEDTEKMPENYPWKTRKIQEKCISSAKDSEFVWFAAEANKNDWKTALTPIEMINDNTKKQLDKLFDTARHMII